MSPAPTPCSHLAAVRNGPKPPGGCRACLAQGGDWLHLRFCLTCGEIACCDESPNRHASGHAAATGHPVARSREPEEMWAWCYPDAILIELEGLEIWG